jgi:hypothetical protein
VMSSFLKRLGVSLISRSFHQRGMNKKGYQMGTRTVLSLSGDERSVFHSATVGKGGANRVD